MFSIQYIYLLQFTCVITAGKPVAFYKQELIKDLFEDYNKDVAPQNRSSDIVEMNITFHLRNILTLEETSEILTSSGWMDIFWHDFRLSWKEGSYGGIENIHIYRNDIWIPDVTVDNTATQYKVVGQEKDILRITSEGLIRWVPGDVFRTRCSMNVMYFPFDEQTCDVKILTWTAEVVTVRFGSVDAPLHSVLEEHGEWKVTGIKADIKNDQTVPSAYIYIDIRRRSAFHILNIVLPIITATFINAFVFILPAESGEKINLATALFLSYAVFLSYITDNMPNTSTTISLLGAFVALQLVLSALAIVCTVIILKFHLRKGCTHNDMQDGATQLITRRQICPKLNSIFFIVFFMLGVGASATLLVMLEVKFFT